MEKTRTVKLTIDGQEYQLAWDFNALADTERAAKCNLLAAVSEIANLSFDQMRGLLLAFVRGANPDSKMTVAEAAALIRYNTIFPISEALAETILLSIPEVADKPGMRGPVKTPHPAKRAKKG